MGLDIATVDQEVRFCSGGERQGVAITRAMYYEAALTILDEPITALSLKGTKQVLEFVTHLKERDIGVIVISHNIGHVYSVADRFILMSKGKKVVDVEKDSVTSMNAVVLDDAIVESNTIIAAGSVVTKGTKVESGCVYAGIPAKKIKEISKDLLEGEIIRIANAYETYASWYKK